MADIQGIIAIVMSLGMAPAIIYIRGQYKLKEKQLQLEKQPDERPATARAFLEQAFPIA